MSLWRRKRLDFRRHVIWLEATLLQFRRIQPMKIATD
jgi:hypothetical protein